MKIIKINYPNAQPSQPNTQTITISGISLQGEIRNRLQSSSLRAQ